MSASATMEVATTLVLTLLEVMFAPALVTISLTVMDTRVKVGPSNACTIVVITVIQAVVKYIYNEQQGSKH